MTKNYNIDFIYTNMNQDSDGENVGTNVEMYLLSRESNLATLYVMEKCTSKELKSLNFWSTQTCKKH